MNEKTQFTLRINKKTKEEIEKIAKKENRSTNNMIEMILKKYIKKETN